ncbi:MAG: hypothetical protein NUV80_02405 [Candidatus Berkelbacteria bacterium]|nr:hypothetical protein [Candidatus Berkelbacteria bacterium]
MPKFRILNLGELLEEQTENPPGIGFGRFLDFSSARSDLLFGSHSEVREQPVNVRSRLVRLCCLLLDDYVAAIT